MVVGEDQAQSLGLWPASDAKVHLVEEASSVGEVFLLPGAVELELLDEEGQALSKITADLAVQEGLLEPLITDVTIDELGIQVISFGKGLWRHITDPPDKTRSSAK